MTTYQIPGGLAALRALASKPCPRGGARVVKVHLIEVPEAEARADVRADHVTTLTLNLVQMLVKGAMGKKSYIIKTVSI
jgi:hypothetical protein